MKKILSLLLVSAFVLSGVPSFAEVDTAELEKLVLSVKERITDVSDYEDFSANERQGSDGNVTYNLHWSSSSDGYRSVDVNVASDGVITGYSENSGEYGTTGARIRSMDRKTAMENAGKLIDLLNPSLAAQLTVSDDGITESLWDNGFTFEVQRIVNGIPVPECSGSVSVDENAEKITYFYIEYYQGAEFETDSDAILSCEVAATSYMEKAGLELEYYLPYSEDGQKAQPVYVFKNRELKIHAISGEGFVPVKSYNGVYYRTEEAAADKAMVSMNSVAGGGLSKTEMAEMDKLRGLITKDEAVKMIFDNPYIPIDESMPLMSFNVYKYSDDKYFGNFSFSENYSQVTMNMKTGEIQSFYIHTDTTDKEKNMTEAEAYKLASDGAEYLAGEKFKEYRKSDENTSYTRYVNSIPFKQDVINLTVDKTQGYIRSYSISYTDCEFEPADSVLGESEAGTKLFEQLAYEPEYERHVEDNKTSFKLIYDFDRQYIRMDAVTGEIEKDEQRPVFEGYTDISGHYAEEIINTLAKYGIHTEGDKFTPDEKITQSDYAKLLSCIVRRYGDVILKNASDENAEWLIDRGVIFKDEYAKDEPLSRLHAAKLLIRAIGAEDYAKLEGIFKTPFADVTADVGYVSLLYGMNVFKGDNLGNFRPDENITYAEAAVIIYNYLSR